MDEWQKLALMYPEWLIYGTWDAPRCLICGGFQHPGLNRIAGHKPKCLRLKMMKSLEERLCLTEPSKE